MIKHAYMLIYDKLLNLVQFARAIISMGELHVYIHETLIWKTQIKWSHKSLMSKIFWTVLNFF